jgi:type II secretory pathway component PulF
MTTFRDNARDEKGRNVSGTVEAPNPQEAATILRSPQHRRYGPAGRDSGRQVREEGPSRLQEGGTRTTSRVRWPR